MNNETESIKIKTDGHFKVAIFGSARIQKNDAIYEQVRTLALALGEKGIDVVTGGGPGLMEAANEGHILGSDKEHKDAHSIGIGIKLPWEQEFNKSVEYKEEFNIFSKRLDEFMLLSDDVIVTPGGLGTLLELFYTWQLVQVHHICDTPIILMGEEWKGLLEWIKDNPLEKGYIDPQDFRLIYHVENPVEAIEIIEKNYQHFLKGGKNFCLNYEKYKID